MSPDYELPVELTRTPRQCPICETEFTPSMSSRQLYCSPRCKILSRRADPAALQPHTCPTCQGEFTANPRIRQVYCSPICRRTSEKQRDRERDQQRARRLGEPVTSPDPVPPGPRAADPLIPTAVRNCPHCDQPVTIVALLATAEAARPTIHQPSSSIIALRRP